MPGRGGLELPIAGRSVVAERRGSAASAASCGAALLSCVLAEWDSSDGSPRVVKAKSDTVKGGGEATPVSSSHKRMSSTVQYKGHLINEYIYI